jgi:hypothetical protein
VKLKLALSPGFSSRSAAHIPVGAAEGCDLLILLLKNKIKRSQPAAAPTGFVAPKLTQIDGV